MKDLIFTLAFCVAFAAVFVFYCVKISAKKIALKKAGKSAAKKSTPFVSSMILCALVEVLPFLIPLRTFVIFVVCLCGIAGETLVLKERLEKLEE